jgi:Zinc finger, C3HC4 type (RING finger)
MDIAQGMMEVSALTFCGYCIYRWQNKNQKLKDLIDFTQQAAALTPSMLRKAMEAGANFSMMKNIQNFEEGKNYARGTAFIQGIVDTAHPLRSILNHSTKLVLSSVSSELIFSNNKNFEEVDGKTESKFACEFVLSDPTGTEEQVVVNKSTSTQFRHALHLIHSLVHMRKLSPLEKFLSWVLFCIKLFLSMSSIGKKLSGFKVGTKRVERGIMVGQFMLIFGEVIYDRFNKELRMPDPLFFLKEKSQLLEIFKDKRIKLVRHITLVAAIMVMCGLLLLKRATTGLTALYKKYRQLRLDSYLRAQRIMASHFLCSICSNNARDIIFKPCLHLVVCADCHKSHILPKQVCPQCNQGISDVVKIFAA